MANKRIPIFRIFIILLFIVSLEACNLPQSKPDSGKSFEALQNIPEMETFGELASFESAISVKVGEEASIINLDEGVTIQIPAGAFPGANQMQVTRVEISFDQIAPDVSPGKFFVIETEENVPVLGSPVILEVPGFSQEVTVVRYEGDTWVKVPIEQGETAHVNIDHFSKGVFGFFEWWSERDIELGESLDSMDNNSEQANSRRFIEGGNENVHAFFGVNEQNDRTEEELCAEILALLQNYNLEKNREFPDVNAGSYQLGLFLFDGNYPSRTGGPFWDITENSMEEIESRLLGNAEQVSPAELLKICIEANNGNVPLGILAAHNYLKELTYKGRVTYTIKNGVDPKYAIPVGRLESWREGDNISPNGEYDKMGPLYHIFAAMTGALWLPSDASGPAIAAGEAFLRTFRIDKDRPDTQKAYADQCGIEGAAWLRDNPPSSTITVKPDPDILESSSELTAIVVSDLHGSYCDESEGTFEYTWSVNVMQDTASGVYWGTIKFHNCPGGGRVLYHVVGDEREGDIITLIGTKKKDSGGGQLNMTSPDARTFYLDLKNGQLTDPPPSP